MISKFLTRYNLNLYTLLLICVVLTVSSFLSIHAIKKTHNSWPVIMDLYQLKSDISTANILLRNAALAPDTIKPEEITKMLVPRSSATKIYDNLSLYSLTTEERKVLEDMKRDRSVYRDEQNAVVTKIKQNEIVWDQLLQYQKHQALYQERVDYLLKSIKKRNEQRYAEILKGFVLAHMVTFAGLCFLLLIKKR